MVASLILSNFSKATGLLSGVYGFEFRWVRFPRSSYFLLLQGTSTTKTCRTGFALETSLSAPSFSFLHGSIFFFIVKQLGNLWCMGDKGRQISKFKLSHMLSVWPQSNISETWCLGFLLCEVGIMISIWWGGGGEYLNRCNAFGIVSGGLLNKGQMFSLAY